MSPFFNETVVVKYILTLIAFCACTYSYAQRSIEGKLISPKGNPVEFANIVLYSAIDSSIAKVETSDIEGKFVLRQIPNGDYFLKASFIGFEDVLVDNLNFKEKDKIVLGTLEYSSASIELAEATIKAQRALVEVKPDRTVFNVQGTINSVGSDGLSLLRKAPSVTVDNNNNISVLGRTGVLVYVDGKRLPLAGDELTGYLENLTAEQIDRIDIITNPGAKYEAEGNAGIIDIRLKKNENFGSNGSANASYSKGRHAQYNTGVNANYRNAKMNFFASAGVADRTSFNEMDFINYLNGLVTVEDNDLLATNENYNLRIGTDIFLNDKNTLGFLVSGRTSSRVSDIENRISIANVNTPLSLDSILLANTISEYDRDQYEANINYRFDNGDGESFNIDLDYGNYNNEAFRNQPNQYLDPNTDRVTSEIVLNFNTPRYIDIYTAKADYENKLWGGVFGIGTKFSRVSSDNSFLVFDNQDGQNVRIDRQSNLFKYNENVFAGYLSYNRAINEKLNFSGGLRAEVTDAEGILTAFQTDLQEPPVFLNYLSWFPSAGLTWQVAPTHSLALNYGRRINRPNYNVLNPFNNQLSQLSFEKGNPFLRPEIVNNIELGYTLKYRYNFKLAYSKTTDQITRLIGPDENDPRASFITWSNLSEQNVYSFNISAPLEIVGSWNAYINLSGAQIDNQADYGDGAIVDVQVFTYSIYQQHTFNLPGKLRAEVSGYFAGPGVWGGVFEYETSWSLNLGLQRKFLDDKLNVRLSANDLFYQTGWDGFSEFDGLMSVGSGRWDSRRVGVSLNYSFGNEKVKSRKRNTGLENEAGRVGS